MAPSKLSREDVERLLSEPSADTKARTATRLAEDFNAGALSSSERKLAEDIFRIMAKDAELQVRQALAVNLKESAALPHDVAVTLARDVETVALPILQFSKALSDDDLVAIVSSQNVAKQVAIARREEVSSTLSDALAGSHNEDVIVNLVANEGAALSEESLQKIVDEFGARPQVQGSLVGRAKLPVTVAERLVTMVSTTLRDHLAQRHHLPAEVVNRLVTQSRERATITLAAGIDREDVEQLVRQLRLNGRLTPAIMLRGVCMGDMPFFEAAMAEWARIPLANAQRLIYDPGGGFPAIYEKAGMPKPMLPAFLCAMDVARETELDGGEQDRERYCRRMIERILTQYEDLGVSIGADDIDYLLMKMDQLPPSLTAKSP